MEKLNRELVNKNSLLLWQGVGVSLFGDIIYNMAIAKCIYDMTESTLMVSIIAILNILPTIILMPIAGVWVERWQKKSVLIYSDLIRGLLMILLGICFIFQFNFALICVVSVLLGIAEAFFRPSIITLVPLIIKEKLLIRASSITEVVSNTVTILANFIGGMLLLIFNIPVIIIFNGITFIISAISELFIKVEEEKLDEEAKPLNYNFQEIKDSFATTKIFFHENKTYLGLLITYCTIVFLLSVYTILRLPFFESNFNIELYGIAMGFISLGGIIAPILLSVIDIDKHKYQVLLFAIIGMSIPMLFIGTKYAVIVVGIMFLYGFFNSILHNIFGVALVIGIPAEIRARISAINTPLILVSSLLGQLVGGILGDIAPMDDIIRCVFVIILLVVMINTRKLVKN
ncbi:MAG: hypothetical protein BEN18_01135 [Epulopiscium sp. Nuni2H_MBin001]|nr:MAG: hypothetical protein BEN18_01135 [Epulopiscium sp. Nuni2H_MBin001]